MFPEKRKKSWLYVKQNGRDIDNLPFAYILSTLGKGGFQDMGTHQTWGRLLPRHDNYILGEEYPAKSYLVPLYTYLVRFHVLLGYFKVPTILGFYFIELKINN